MLLSTRYKIIIYSLSAAILLTLLGFWLYIAQAQARDYQRLADLKVWQNILSEYYLKNGTYRIANCSAGETLSQCLKTTAAGRDINNVDDPVNAGSYRYVVADLSDSDYQITFSFEAGIGGLGAGQYVWTKNGIKK